MAPLKPAEAAMFAARQTAMQAVKQYCIPGYNTVVCLIRSSPAGLSGCSRR
jgi:hypothetical protein